MHEHTKAIAEFETEEDAKAAGYGIPLTKERAERLRGVPRSERAGVLEAEVRALAKLHPLGKVEGLTDEDIRKIRNAAKRERRARRG